MKKKLVLAYSGGLDTSYCLMKLSKEGYEVHAVNINTGGFDKLQIEDMRTKAMQMGANTYKSIDALYAFTSCETSISPLGCVIDNNKPNFIGVSEMLIRSTGYTLDLLKAELLVRKNELNALLHTSILERIFIENRLYRLSLIHI